MKKYAVIVAGGTGTRMGGTLPKQFLLLQGKPVLWYTLAAFLAAYHDMQIILVSTAEHLMAARALADTTSDPQRIQITTGGETRYHSVKNGLQLVEKDAVVFVHDGVRCLVTPALIQDCYEAAVAKGNAVPAVKAVDSIRLQTAHGNERIDRNNVRIIQTPQTFRADMLLKAFEQNYDPCFTDEAAVVENTGVPIHLVEGEVNNIKITRPVDLLLAASILEERAQV